MARNWDGLQVFPNRHFLIKFVRRIRCGPRIGLVDPYARAEVFGVLVGVGDIVLVREQDVRDAACFLEELAQL